MSSGGSIQGRSKLRLNKRQPCHLPKMPRIPSIRPRKDANRHRPWRVDIPASRSPSGKRARFFFGTEAEAEAFAEGRRGVQGPAQIVRWLQAIIAELRKLRLPAGHHGSALLAVLERWKRRGGRCEPAPRRCCSKRGVHYRGGGSEALWGMTARRSAG